MDKEEVVRGVHTRVAGVVQVYLRLQVVEEEGRKVEQEVEREDQGEHCSCGEGNSWVESILSFSGVCRFTSNFRYWRKKAKSGK